jgi:hypothetical protein
MCLTGFGNTTADLTENSTTDLIQMDSSENVVAAPEMYVESSKIDWEEFRQKVKKASQEAVLETNRELSQDSRYDALFQEADEAFNLIYQEPLNELRDVGWQSQTNYKKTTPTLKNTNFHFPHRKARDGIMHDSFYFS